MSAPGWYQDPAGSSGQRWWDGARWTMELSSPPTPTTAPTARASAGVAWATIVAGAVSIVGAFLPWIVLRAALLGQVTKSGTEGTDGWLFVAFGVVGVGLGGLMLRRTAARWHGVCVVVLAVVSGVAAVYEANDIATRIRPITSDMGQANIGVGIWLLLAAACLWLIAGVCALFEKRRVS